MKFDIRRLKNPPSSDNILSDKTKWNLKKYKVRRNVFPNPRLLGDKGITKRIIEIFGEEMVKSIIEEAKIARIKGAHIPASKKFYDSFSYEIVKGGGIAIRSTWKWVNHYLRSKNPYQLNIFRRSKERKVIPLRSKTGEVIFRQAPKIGSGGWVHPAIIKYNFIEVGMEKGEKRAVRRVLSLIQTGGLE